MNEHSSTFSHSAPAPARSEGPRSGSGAQRLANTGNNFSIAAESLPDLPPVSASTDVRRGYRFAVRYWLWKHSTLNPVRCCGRFRRAGVSEVQVRVSAAGDRRVAGYAGLQSCGSVWACPVCNASIMLERGLEIGSALETWDSLGGQIGFVTMTLRHNRSQGITEVWDAISIAWQRACGGSSWQRDCARFGIEGWAKVVEVTHGRNGWHVHVHAILFLAAASTAGDLATAFQRMCERWGRAGERLNFGTIVSDGQKAELLTVRASMQKVADYLAKASLTPDPAAAARLRAAAETSRRVAHGVAYELVGSQTKRAKTGLSTRSTWEILDSARLGLADEVGLWAAFEIGSRGRRQWAWSKGIRQRLQLAEKARKDEEIAATETGSADDTVVRITGDGWDTLAKARKLAEALRLVETEGVGALSAWLDSLGVEHLRAESEV